MSASTRTLLVIDDETIDRTIAMHAALRSGYVAIGAASVAEAANHLRDGDRFDCVLLDLSLGDADGLQVLRLLAASNPAVVIIFASGADRRIVASSRRMAFQLGLSVGGVLEKPIRPAKLRTLLERPSTPPAVASAPAECVDPADLRDAIAAGEIVPWFQPKADLASGAILGAEALARWIRPSGEAILPAAFIDLADREGMLPALTDAVLDRSLEACARWRLQGSPISVAVNLSPTALHDDGLTGRIERMLRRHGVPPGALVLEVTEGSAVPDTVRAIETLTRLRIWGVNLAVDDFGTGHSSLLALARMPFNELKIDRAFVTTATCSQESLKIVTAIASLGRALGLKVVAEGIETLAIATLAGDAGCDIGQGWHFGLPAPPAAFEALLRPGLPVMAA